MVEVRKRDKESSTGLARRFSRKIQLSRLLTTARKLQFRERPKSATRQRKDALRRIEKRAGKERLRKLGKLKR